jgi:hypothetical protein
MIAKAVAAPGMMLGIMGVAIVRPRIMGVISVLGQGVVFLEAFVVSMPMPSSIGADVRFKYSSASFDCNEAHLIQHVHEHGVVFELQEVFGDLQRHMAISQVIRGARQMPGNRSGNPRDVFQRSLDDDMTCIVCHEHVTIAQGWALVQRQSDFGFAVIQPQTLATAPALRKGQREGGCVVQMSVDRLGASDDLGRYVHDQNRK